MMPNVASILFIRRYYTVKDKFFFLLFVTTSKNLPFVRKERETTICTKGEGN